MVSRPSQLVRVYDKSLVPCELVVERPAGCVAGLGLPVNAAAAGGLGRFINGQDQLPPDSLAAQARQREEVLQVAHLVQATGTAVQNEVHQTHDLCLRLRHQALHRLRRLEEALPGGRRDRLRQRTVPGAAIEGVVAVPQPPPGSLVAALQRADANICGHRVARARRARTNPAAAHPAVQAMTPNSAKATSAVARSASASRPERSGTSNHTTVTVNRP